ncbi:MAG: hypothetical protein IKD75_09585 [Prevotella sp.]|nr:hypothetical protein [Prevotella sp.]
MKYLIIVLVIIVFFLIKFYVGLRRDKKFIRSQGGMKVMYKHLIDGLLQYHSARIIQDETNLITIAGSFTDPIMSRTCGLWSVIIQHSFNILTVRYQAHHDLDGGETAKKLWDFSPNTNQEEMLSIIRKKADEWDVYGIIK